MAAEARIGPFVVEGIDFATNDGSFVVDAKKVQYNMSIQPESFETAIRRLGLGCITYQNVYVFYVRSDRESKTEGQGKKVAEIRLKLEDLYKKKHPNDEFKIYTKESPLKISQETKARIAKHPWLHLGPHCFNPNPANKNSSGCIASYSTPDFSFPTTPNGNFPSTPPLPPVVLVTNEYQGYIPTPPTTSTKLKWVNTTNLQKKRNFMTAQKPLKVPQKRRQPFLDEQISRTRSKIPPVTVDPAPSQHVLLWQKIDPDEEMRNLLTQEVFDEILAQEDDAEILELVAQLNANPPRTTHNGDVNNNCNKAKEPEETDQVLQFCYISGCSCAAKAYVR